MATLLDTSALVVLIRKRRAARHDPVARAARDEISGRRALIASVTVTELLVGARDPSGARRLQELLERIPTVGADREVAERAATLGAEARRRGSPIPLADLLVAATALWLDVPLLTCDSDFERGRRLGSVEAGGGKEGGVGAAGAGAGWHALRLHPASVPG